MFLVNIFVGLLALGSITEVLAAPIEARAPAVENIGSSMNTGMARMNNRAVEKRDGYGEYKPYGYYGNYVSGYPEPNKRDVIEKRTPEPVPVPEVSSEAEKESEYGSYSPYATYQDYNPPTYNEYGKYSSYKEKRAPEAVAEPAAEPATQ